LQVREDLVADRGTLQDGGQAGGVDAAVRLPPVGQLEQVRHNDGYAEGLVRIARHEDLQLPEAEAQHALYFLRRNVLALLQFEQVLDAVEDPHAPVGLHTRHVACPEPQPETRVEPVVACDAAVPVRVRIVQVLLEDLPAPQEHLTPQHRLLGPLEGVGLECVCAGGVAQVGVVEQSEETPLVQPAHVARTVVDEAGEGHAASRLREALAFEDVHAEADFELVQDLLLDGRAAGDDVLDSAAQLGLHLAEDDSREHVVLDDPCPVLVTLDRIVEALENGPHASVQSLDSLHDGELDPVEQPGHQADDGGSEQLDLAVDPLDVAPPEANAALEQDGHQVEHDAHNVRLGQETLHHLVADVVELRVGVPEDPVQVEVREADPLGHPGGPARLEDHGDPRQAQVTRELCPLVDSVAAVVAQEEGPGEHPFPLGLNRFGVFS